MSLSYLTVLNSFLCRLFPSADRSRLRLHPLQHEMHAIIILTCWRRGGKEIFKDQNLYLPPLSTREFYTSAQQNFYAMTVECIQKSKLTVWLVNDLFCKEKNLNIILKFTLIFPTLSRLYQLSIIGKQWIGFLRMRQCGKHRIHSLHPLVIAFNIKACICMYNKVCNTRHPQCCC